MTEKTQPTDAELFALIKEHFGLDQRRDDTVINRSTGRFHDAQRYRDFAAAVLAIAKWGQPAQAQADSVQEDAALQLIADLVRHIDRETCTHEETHRGGAIWEICNSCGSMWADDKGGKPEFKWPDCVEKARAFLDAARKQGASQ
ncbi:hypothetical protein [Acidovorax sp.]|uniref:hypothetical protein n=1 Tax=Acidovorax sp. TaxID=1872122 RepID=UPI002608A03B|nr:hypothetical protein [Acidovorax sp.]HQS22751.1 hypothetical protein [Acidovorax defluvii]HQS64833.1 hypothetical protein [Acidovorax defluvii]